MKPVIKVWCLPADLTEAQLKELFQEIVQAVVANPFLKIKSEEDLLVLFPKDMMSYGLGSEIYVEITEIWHNPIENSYARACLISDVGKVLEKKFPKAQIICYAVPFNSKEGATWCTPKQ